jgi:hypothetical protein
MHRMRRHTHALTHTHTHAHTHIAGISRGKANFLAPVYVNTPVCITVEGANALTRSLIIYGQVKSPRPYTRQGLTRSHPHLLHIKP